MPSATTTTTAPTVAFFGATGGVTNVALVHTLKAGYKATALVRTPQKLRKQLTAQGLDEAMLDAQLTILQGNALDVAAVKQALTASSPSGLPTIIVTGLGAAPAWKFDLLHPGQILTIDQPQLCGTAAQTVVTALREIYAEKPRPKANRPLLTFISTTGISRGAEDVPFSMRFLYHQLLAKPHADKKKMEETFRAEADGEQGVFRNVIGIRPTLLKGAASYTDAAGLQRVRYGTESRPALGFLIKRADVGHFVFQNVISATERKKEFEGDMISLTS